MKARFMSRGAFPHAFALVLLSLVCCVAIGCSAVSKPDAERIHVLWEVIGPRHREYIAKDPALKTDEDRRMRLETVDRMDKAVRDAREGAK